MKTNKSKKFLTVENVLLVSFLIVLLVSIYSTYHITGNIMDSDSSSELILAHHLSETRQWLSSDWFYSTELRAVYTQMVLSPLFILFNDWHLVHFLGAVIFQLILLASYLFLCKECNLSKKSVYIGFILLLLPVSVSYGRIVLYNNSYIVSSILSFLSFGLIAGFSKYKNRNTFLNVFYIVCLAILSFAGGLNGTRQLLIFTAPLLVAVFTVIYIKDKYSYTAFVKTKCCLYVLIPASVSAIFTFAGYFINSSIFSKIYSFSDYSEYQLSVLPSSEVSNLIYGFFHQFGFRDEIDLISLIGIFSVLGALAGLYILGYSVFCIFNKNISFIQNILYGFFFFSFTVTTFVFIFTGGQATYHFYLYYIPVFIWAIPCITAFIDIISSDTAILNFKRLVPVVIIFILIFNGFINLCYFHGKGFSEQKYEGTTYRNIHIKADLSGAVNFINENNYELGYSTFWNGNVITELTDGKTKIVNIYFARQFGFDFDIAYYDWLTLRSNRDIISEKTFVILSMDEIKHFDAIGNIDCSLVYEDTKYRIYHINDVNLFKSTIV